MHVTQPATFMWDMKMTRPSVLYQNAHVGPQYSISAITMPLVQSECCCYRGCTAHTV